MKTEIQTNSTEKQRVFRKVKFTQKNVRTSVYIQTCTYDPVRTNLYMQICTYGLARLCESPGLVWRIAIHKKCFLHIFIGVARERARVCIQIRHCTFLGYSSENAIPTNFHRVPPWPDGLYFFFAVVDTEMRPCPGNANSVRYDPVRTNLYMQICTYGLVRLCASLGQVWRIAIHKTLFL